MTEDSGKIRMSSLPLCEKCGIRTVMGKGYCVCAGCFDDYLLAPYDNEFEEDDD